MVKWLVVSGLILVQTIFAQGTFTDTRDGKKYKTVKIGSQVWMAKNLEYAGPDGDIYGQLFYDWENAMLYCPDSWHLPSEDDWRTLAQAVGGTEIAGQKLKARSGWEKWDCEWTEIDDRGRTIKKSKCNSDSYGFSALPISNGREVGAWWTASENYSNAAAMVLIHNAEDIRRGSYSKSTKFGVRCLKGEKRLPSNLAAKKAAIDAEDAAKKTCKAEGNKWINGVCKTDEEIAEETCVSSIGMVWLNGECKTEAGICMNAGNNWVNNQCRTDEELCFDVGNIWQNGECKTAEEICTNAGNSWVNNLCRTNDGILVSGSTLAEKLAWLDRSADSHNTYILEVNADEVIAPHTFEYKGSINITIILRGVGANRTIRLSTHGAMFVVKPNITFILDNNIILYGHSGNTHTMVWVDGGTFRMNPGSTITGNIRSITGDSGGGGVFVKGTFIMNGGTISGNTAADGGGVYMARDANVTFTMNGGIISGNTAQNGGGVTVSRAGNFTMNGGTISGNAAQFGGGVSVVGTGGTRSAIFNMHRGIITNNIASTNGGGVYIDYHNFGASPNFTKSGGTITGYNSDRSNGNVVTNENGALARRGHAVWVKSIVNFQGKEIGGGMRKETTADSGTNLSFHSNGYATGAWDK